MQNSVAKKSYQQNSMSKLEMVPWNPLSLVIKIMLYSRAGTERYLANVGRGKDKEGTHLLGSFICSQPRKTVGFFSNAGQPPESLLFPGGSSTSHRTSTHLTWYARQTPTSYSAKDPYFWVKFKAITFKIHHGLIQYSWDCVCVCWLFFNPWPQGVSVSQLYIQLRKVRWPMVTLRARQGWALSHHLRCGWNRPVRYHSEPAVMHSVLSKSEELF